MDRPTALEVATDLLGLTAATAADAPDDLVGLVGSSGRPRFLLPLATPEVTRAACLAFIGLRYYRRTIAQRVIVAGAFAVGAGRRVAPERRVVDRSPDSLLAHLGALLGRTEAPLLVAMGLGTVDTVWKPTLQLFASDGTPVAFVKMGLGPVAAALVARETAVLQAWGDHPDPRLVVPEVLATGSWRGEPLVAVAPLPADSCRLPAPVSSWPVRTLDDPEPDGPLARSSWWADQQAKAAAATDRHVRILEQVEQRHGGVDHGWARWHGDWVPWNLARCSHGIVAWDWEYSEPAAPVGLDDVHGRYQRHRVMGALPVTDSLQRADAPTRWLADAHVAMLVARDAELGRLGGAEPEHRAELLDAADRALR